MVTIFLSKRIHCFAQNSSESSALIDLKIHRGLIDLSNPEGFQEALQMCYDKYQHIL